MQAFVRACLDMQKPSNAARQLCIERHTVFESLLTSLRGDTLLTVASVVDSSVMDSASNETEVDSLLTNITSNNDSLLTNITLNTTSNVSEVSYALSSKEEAVWSTLDSFFDEPKPKTTFDADEELCEVAKERIAPADCANAMGRARLFVKNSATAAHFKTARYQLGPAVDTVDVVLRLCGDPLTSKATRTLGCGITFKKVLMPLLLYTPNVDTLAKIVFSGVLYKEGVEAEECANISRISKSNGAVCSKLTTMAAKELKEMVQADVGSGSYAKRGTFVQRVSAVCAQLITQKGKCLELVASVERRLAALEPKPKAPVEPKPEYTSVGSVLAAGVNETANNNMRPRVVTNRTNVGGTPAGPYALPSSVAVPTSLVSRIHMGNEEVYLQPEHGEGFNLPATPDPRDEALSATIRRLRYRVHAQVNGHTHQYALKP